MSSDEDEIIKEELENENALDLRVSNSSTLTNKDTKRLKNDNSLYDNLDNIAIKNLNNLNTNYLFQHFQKLLNNYTNNDYNSKNSNNNNNSNKNNNNGRYEYSASSSSSPTTPPPLSVPPIHSPPMSRRSSQISSPNNIPLLQSWDPYKQYYYYLMNSPSFANNHHLAEAMMETYNNLLTSSSPSVSPLIIDQKRDLHHAQHFHNHPPTYSNNNTNGNNNNHHSNHQSSNHHSLHHGLRQSIFAFKNDKEFRYAEDSLNLNQNELHLLNKFNKGYNCHNLNKKLIYRKDVDNTSNGNEDEDVCREKEDEEEEVDDHQLLHNEVEEDEDEDNETGDDDLENGGNALDLRVSNLSMPSKKDYKPQIDKNSKLSKHYLIQHFQKFFVKRSNVENAEKNENIYCHQSSSPSPPPLPKYAIDRDTIAKNYVDNLLSPSLLINHNHNHNNINSNNNNNNRHHNLTNTFQINQRVFLNELKNDLKDLQYQNSIYSDDLNSKTELRSADTTKQGLSDLNGDRKRISRPLTGRHVRQGTGASPSTLLSLRQMIQDRQKLKELGIPGTQGKTKRRNGKRK